MKTFFYAKITYNSDDQVYYVGFPGFPSGADPEMATFGETEAHAHQMAKECLEGLLQCYIEDGDPIPDQKAVDKTGLVPIAIDECLAFALWLRWQRAQRGLSQSEAARLLSISTKNYQRLENPKRCNPTLRTTIKIRDGFGLEAITI